MELRKSFYMESAEPVQIINKPGVLLQPVPSTGQLKRDAARPRSQYHWQVVWRNVFLFIFLHSSAFYGLYLLVVAAQWKTILFTYMILLSAGLGITAGAHRLWAHRAYKARLPLRILLAIFQTMALQNHIYEWVRDHRVHHKFADSDADPHNAKRGFFFSHMGWLLLRKHKDVFIKGKTVDLSDLEADPVVVFQRKYYLILTPILCFIIPAVIPWYYWSENYIVSWYVVSMFRYTLSLHGTWSVNSAAHIWGTKPYDKGIKPTENITVSIVAFGEGWHNYHHVYPWDYKAAELGNYRTNFSTAFIDIMARIGWAYDLKSVSEEMINKRVKRTGDGSRPVKEGAKEAQDHHHHDDAIWGWGDKDMKGDDMKLVKIDHRKKL